MRAFDQTYADPDFQRQVAAAREGWMSRIPRPRQPDLDVAGLKSSLLSRLLGLFGGRHR